jgi:hypothetical protein
MGSAPSWRGPGAVIIPLRPDVQMDADRRRVDRWKTEPVAIEEVLESPHQLSLFDERPER